MSTLYTRDGNVAFELPGRTVNTFTSGLVRVDTSYAIKTSTIQSERTGSFQVGQSIYGGDTYPAVDGLYLYPEAQEIRKEYGMTELIASFYGRTRTDVPPPTVIERSIKYPNIIDAENFTVISINDLFFEFVVPVGEVVNFRDQDLFDSPLSDPNEIAISGGNFRVNFNKAAPTEVFDNYNYEIIVLGSPLIQQVQLRKPTILVVAQRNFGNFVELEVTYKRNTEQDGWINA